MAKRTPPSSERTIQEAKAAVAGGSCAACLHWQPINNNTGSCTCHAPVVVPGQAMAKFPTTMAEMRCGEFLSRQ